MGFIGNFVVALHPVLDAQDICFQSHRFLIQKAGLVLYKSTVIKPREEQKSIFKEALLALKLLIQTSKQ